MQVASGNNLFTDLALGAGVFWDERVGFGLRAFALRSRRVEWSDSASFLVSCSCREGNPLQSMCCSTRHSSFCSGGSDSEPGASIFPIQQGAEELQGVPRWTDVEPSMEPGGTTILEKGKCCFMEILETPRCTFGLSCIGLCFLTVSLTDA